LEDSTQKGALGRLLENYSSRGTGELAGNGRWDQSVRRASAVGLPAPRIPTTVSREEEELDNVPDSPGKRRISKLQKTPAGLQALLHASLD
jgi:hypothetical protein